jgi:hypothetical protein
LHQISELFQRLSRLTDRTHVKEGAGFQYNVVLMNGSTQTISIAGLRSFESVKDDAENLICWIWNSKDYLKKLADQPEFESVNIENAVNRSPELSICADLANGLKHGGLDRWQRTAHNPRLGEVGYSVHGKAVGNLAFYATKVEVSISDFDEVNVRLPVIDESRSHLFDAFELCSLAIEQLECLRSRIYVRTDKLPT